MRRLTCLVVVALAAAGCGGGGSDDAMVGDAVGTSSTTAPPAVDVGTDAQQPGPDSPSEVEAHEAGSPVDQSVAGVDLASSQAVLDAHLDALAAEDFDRAVALSAGGPQLIALVRGVVHAHNEQQGGRTTLRWVQRSLRLDAETSEQARFTGEAHLQSRVQGPRDSPQETTDRFADPVLTLTGGGWRVTGYRYDGRPVVDHAPAGAAQAAAAVGAVRLRLVGSVAFGNVVGVVVEIQAEGDHAVAVEDAKLRMADEEASAGQVVLAGGRPGWVYTSFARRDDRPDEWTARVVVDGGPAEDVRLSF